MQGVMQEPDLAASGLPPEVVADLTQPLLR
jgi:hypothetical protein